jgi:type II secretory pathway pseudopilin PulG
MSRIAPRQTSVCVLRPRRRGSDGFTIVELLTGIAAVAILIAVVIHAATAVRNASERASEMASARSLGIAWAGYATDHRGAVLPGYASGFEAVDANGESIAAQTVPIAARRWPLRLAPYLGHDLVSLYSGVDRDYATEIATLPDDDALYAVSTFPSFGMNSVFVGGDENFGGYSDIFRETFGRFYVERLSNVQRPDRLIVFATSRTDESTPGSTGPVREGFFRVLPPAWTTPLWDEEFDPEDCGSAGFVSPRHRKGDSEEVAIVTTVDGGVSTSTIDELRDLRRWSNSAGNADWIMEPLGP